MLEWYKIAIGLVFIIALLFIGILILKRKLKKKRKLMERMVSQIPKEILEEFNLAEEKLKGGMEDGIPNYQANNPTKILWEIARGKSGSSNNGISSTEQTTPSRELCSESDRRESIQSGITNSIDKNPSGIRNNKQNSGKSFFARFRRGNRS